MKVFYAATVLCLIALPVQRAGAQEDHAPTVAQSEQGMVLSISNCHELFNSVLAKPLTQVTLLTLMDDYQRIDMCGTIYPVDREAANKFMSLIVMEQNDRYFQYLKKRSLFGDFIKDDRIGREGR